MRLLVIVFLIPIAAHAQVTLKESLPPGTILQNELTLKFDGTMKLDRNGKIETAPMEGSGSHFYTERIENDQKSFRFYHEATSRTAIGFERGERRLDEKHRLIVVERSKGGITHCSKSPMTRDEHSLVAEHFDSLHVAGLLPEKAVSANDTWPIRDDAASALCLFDAMIRNSLVGKLVSVKGDLATIRVEGTAEGLENGAKVKLSVTASGVFDLSAKRLTGLTWEQTDDREQGPISPAIEAKVKVTLVRRELTDEPKELSASARETIEPKNTKFTKWTSLIYRHPDNRFTFVYDANWHAVVQTDTHLVLRYVDRGELITQATITPWKKANMALSHEEIAREFVDATAKQPGWEPDKLLWNGSVPTDKSQKIFRRVASGKQDGLAVVQSFQLVTHQSGAQVIVTCVVRPELLEKLGTKDAALANAIEFPQAK